MRASRRRSAQARVGACLVVLGFAAPFLGSVPPAAATAAVSPVPEFPMTATIGKAFTGRLNIFNSTTLPESLQPNTLTEIKVIPGCSNTRQDCAGGVDPGVFVLGGFGMGAFGCPSVKFPITEVSPGVYFFAPASPVSLPAGGLCVIDFFVTPAKLPTADVRPDIPGIQTNVVSTVRATNPLVITGPFSGTGSEQVTVDRTNPTIATSAQPADTVVGSPVQDTATLTGLSNPEPTGTVTFRLFSDAACTSTVFTSTNPVSPATGTAVSSSYAVARPGTYHWVANYSGDANNSPAGPTACADAAEQVVVGAGPPPPPSRPLLGDFDGDGLTDVAVWRPSNGTWYVRGFSETVWGQADDIPVPADFAGDQRAEIAVWRPSTGTWFIRGVSETVWGQAGDVPVPADYNGDGKADIAVFRPSNGTWYVRGISETRFGAMGDIPVPSDYAGDAKTDLAVFRPANGTWYVRGVSETIWGQTGDIPVPANYAGDAKADLAVYRPANGTWYLRGISETHFGLPADAPVPGNYEGGGTGLAVWRPSNGTWFLRGIAQIVWGQPNDTPV